MDDRKSLHILWTNADPETAQFMLLMYATNSMLNRWWDSVTVIIWGATARVAVENKDVRELIGVSMHAGVKFSACVACARQLGVVEKLEDLGVEVVPWGAPLTELIKSGAPLITI